MIRILGKEKSACPICEKEIDAVITAEEENLYMMMQCEEHGVFKNRIEKNSKLFKKWYRENKKPDLSMKAKMSSCGSACSFNCGSCGEKDKGI